MAFTIPNRPDTGIEADQAEPDKGDFQTLGYQKSGVLSGGATTRTAANTVTVAPISGYLNGEYFNITADTVLGSFTAPTSGLSKFVLILVQKISGVFSVGEVEGTTSNNGESATNARYPDTVDYSAKMLVAVVYYANGDSDINSSSIVDKRVFILPQANPTAVTSEPAPAVGAIGEIRVDSSITPADGQSLVWVKTAATTWTNMGAYSATAAADGAIGPQGALGPAGGTGNIGPQGDLGPQGIQGLQGLQGLEGDLGPQGIQGIQGLQGLQGDTGPQGLVGTIGPIGPIGPAGAAAAAYSWDLRVNGEATTNITNGEAVNFVGSGATLVTRLGNNVYITSTDSASQNASDWATPRTITLSGNVTGSITGVDGSGNIDITTSINGYLPLTGSWSYGHVFPTASITGAVACQDLRPTADETFNLGLSTLKWSRIYAQTGYFTTGNFTGNVYGNNLGTASDKWDSGFFSGTVYTASVYETSDLRLKEDLGAPPGLSFVQSLNPLSYRLKDNPNKKRWGFGAQDVEKACADHDLPDAGVCGTPPEGDTKYLNYNELMAPMVKAIQELTERLEAIENG